MANGDTPQSRYYHKNKNDPEYRKRANEARRRWYEKIKNDPAYKEKKRQKAKEYYDKNRWKIKAKQRRKYYEEGAAEKRREWYVKRKYGLSTSEIQSILASQGGVCAACGSDDPQHKRGWQTDHCHTTGKVRGVLCGLCNVGIGHCRENIETLRKWIEYLEKHNK